MTFPERWSATLHVYSEGVANEWGDPAESWSTGTSLACYGVAPGTPGEDYEPGRTSSEIPMFLFGASDKWGTAKARDRITWQSELYEIDGRPEDFNYGPFGYAPGVRIRLMRVEG